MALDPPMMELMAMLQQQQQQQCGSPACSDTLLALDAAGGGGDQQLDQAIDLEIQQLMQLKQAMQQRQQARLNNSSPPAPGCASPLPLSAALISPANSVTLPLPPGSTLANNWTPSGPNMSPQPLAPNGAAPGPMVRHSIDMGAAGRNGFLPPAMPGSQQQQLQQQQQLSPVAVGVFQAGPGAGFSMSAHAQVPLSPASAGMASASPGSMRHSIEVSMPAATQLQLQQQLQQQQQQLLALSTSCGLTGALSNPLSQDHHQSQQQQQQHADAFQQSLLYSSIDGAFAVSAPNMLAAQASPFAAASTSDLCAFNGNRLSLDACALQQHSAELAAFVAGPGSNASSSSYFAMPPTTSRPEGRSHSFTGPPSSSHSFTGPTGSQGYGYGYTAAHGMQGVPPLPRKAGSFTAGCGQTSGFASSAFYGPGVDGSYSSQSPRSMRLEAELFGDASGLVIPAAACGGRAAGGGGGGGGGRGAPLVGANGQPLNSSAPRWAGSFWHPLAEVVRTGQLSNKGTGVFIPGGVKPPAPASSE